jgi:hypothetical protein
MLAPLAFTLIMAIRQAKLQKQLAVLEESVYDKAVE